MQKVESPELDNFIRQFVKLEQTELTQITSAFKPKTLKKGQVILRPGDVCKDLVFVRSGCIRMYYMSGDIEISAWFSLSNTIAMEIQSFITGQPSICYLEAIEPSEIFILPKKNLEILYQMQPKTHELIRKIWEIALVLVIPRFSSLQNDSAGKRYLDLLKQPDLLQHIPQKYLASFIGVTPTSLSRIRKKIKL